jgi:hypothetical protein
MVSRFLNCIPGTIKSLVGKKCLVNSATYRYHKQWYGTCHIPNMQPLNSASRHLQLTPLAAADTADLKPLPTTGNKPELSTILAYCELFHHSYYFQPLNSHSMERYKQRWYFGHPLPEVPRA